MIVNPNKLGYESLKGEPLKELNQITQACQDADLAGKWYREAKARYQKVLTLQQSAADTIGWESIQLKFPELTKAELKQQVAEITAEYKAADAEYRDKISKYSLMTQAYLKQYHPTDSKSCVLLQEEHNGLIKQYNNEIDI